MRIVELHLENYRGVVQATISFPSTGVTIIEGDNEAGKTSLTQALDLVLNVRDDSKAQVVKDSQPVGRDVGPEVRVHIESGPYRFELAKRWLRRPSTTLVVHAPAPEQLTGREAHDRVQAILDETLDRDLWKALRLEQGSDLQQVAFGSSSLGRALDLAAGGAADADSHDVLWDRIVAERDRYWTPTGKRSADRVRLAERLQEAQATATRCRDELRDLDDKTARLARLRDDGAALVRRVHDARAQEAELAERARAVAALVADRDRTASARDLAAATRERSVMAAEARRTLVDRVGEAARSAREAATVLAESQPALAAAKRRQSTARERRAGLAAELHEAERRQRQAQEDRDHHRNRIELEQLGERLGRIQEMQVALVAAETEIATATVSAEVAEAVEQAELDLARAEAAAAASATTVRIEASQAVTAVVDHEAHEVEAGADRQWQVGTGAVVEVPGVARITVGAGAEARAVADVVTDARHALAELCARFEVADSRDARRRVQALVDAHRTRDDAEARIAADLRDLTVEELQGKIEGHRVRIAEFEARRDGDRDLPADFDAAKEAARAADQVVESLRGLLDRATEEMERADAAVHAAGQDDALYVQKAEWAQRALTDAGEALAAARAAEPDEQLAAALADAETRLHEATAALAEQDRRLEAADPESIAVLLANAAAARQRAEADQRRTADECTGLQTLLEHTVEQGLAHRLDVALTERDRLQLEVDRLESRAEAARLLHETFERRRAAARARYVAPFRDQIERLGRLVFGPTLQVELDAELRIASRTVDGTTLRIDQLSTGAREQLGMLARLACAAIVAEDGGAPVVFDDALGWTDPARLSQMAAAIALAAQKCQVVILTCTPGRFSGVGGATVVQLPQGGTEGAGTTPATGRTTDAAAS
jgi:hypothetical protein